MQLFWLRIFTSNDAIPLSVILTGSTSISNIGIIIAYTFYRQSFDSILWQCLNYITHKFGNFLRKFPPYIKRYKEKIDKRLNRHYLCVLLNRKSSNIYVLWLCQLHYFDPSNIYQYILLLNARLWSLHGK